jgi:hypothetical protein
MAAEQQQSEILERGSIYFLYRPKVEGAEEEQPVESLEDVERTYLILSPDKKKHYRRLVIGRKKLPEVEDRDRYWGFVETVGNRPEEVKKDLGEEFYQTKTRGERKLPAARVAGEGVYAIVDHGNHAHLAYVLELPARPGEPQQEMNIAPEASYIFTIKNPEQPSPRGVGLRPAQKPELPEPLQREFRGRRFIPAEPELLDREGTEFVLIGATEKPDEELGIDLAAKCHDERCAKVLRDLRLSKAENPIEPEVKGEWK